MEGKYVSGRAGQRGMMNIILQHWIFRMNYTAKRSCTRDFEAIKSHTQSKSDLHVQITIVCYNFGFYRHAHTYTCSMHIHEIVRAQMKKAQCALHMKSAHNAQSISVLLIINKQEMHLISHIASFAAAALCKQDSAISCVCAHFVLTVI